MIIVLTRCETKKKKIRSLSDPTMKFSICDDKIVNTFGDFSKF
jgi:hypothetical protein